MTWWANRKSKIGMSPIAKEPPPKSPGKPWWTDPPTALPQPEYIEYVVQYQAQLLARKPSQQTNALLAHVAAWLRSARHLLHVHAWDASRPDLGTTDGLLIAADDALREAIIACHKAGVVLPKSVLDVNHALQAKLLPIRNKRAIERAKRDNGVTIRKAAHR